MSATETNTLNIAGIERLASLPPDFPDIRDHFYEPALIPLPHQFKPDFDQLRIRDQGKDGACVGFALAAVIDLQIQQKKADVDFYTCLLYTSPSPRD